MIRWRTEFHNSVMNANFTVQVRIYKSLSGFRRMHVRETGMRAPDRLNATQCEYIDKDGIHVFDMAFHEPFVGAGCVSHEALHTALDVYRHFTGNNEVTLKPGISTGEHDLFGNDAYISNPEEMVCDILGGIVKDFWNKWNENS